MQSENFSEKKQAVRRLQQRRLPEWHRPERFGIHHEAMQSHDLQSSQPLRHIMGKLARNMRSVRC